jgi:hypothetical protein
MTRIHWSRYLDVAGGLILMIVLPPTSLLLSPCPTACTPAALPLVVAVVVLHACPCWIAAELNGTGRMAQCPLLLMPYDLSRPVAFLVYTTTIVVVDVTYTVPVR